MTGFDELWQGGPRLKRDGGGYKLSTDSVLLGDFAGVKKNSRCLDLGSGAGVLSILLAARQEGVKVTGVEILREAAALARENAAENGLESRVEIITADLREYKNFITAGGFDFVVSNPPYFAQNTGYSAPESARAAAREEKLCTLADICGAARWALRWGGGFALVHRPERLGELICAMSGAGIEPKRLRLVHHSFERAPSLVLLEGRRGGAPGLAIEPPLALSDPGGGDSLEVQRIYRRGAYAPEKGGGGL